MSRPRTPARRRGPLTWVVLCLAALVALGILSIVAVADSGAVAEQADTPSPPRKAPVVAKEESAAADIPVAESPETPELDEEEESATEDSQPAEPEPERPAPPTQSTEKPAPAPSQPPKPKVVEPEPEVVKVQPHWPELAVSDVAAQIVTGGKKGKIWRTAPPKALAPLSADGTSIFKLRFTAVDASLPERPALKVHQAFAVFTDKETSQTPVVLAAVPTEENGKYSLDVDFTSDKIRARFHHLSSSYTISILLGSFTSRSGYSWDVGTVQLTLPEEDPATRPKILPGQPDPVDYAPKAEIKHVFRPSQKVPPKVVSYAAAAAVLVVPWVVLLGLWSTIRLPINLPPPSAILPHTAFLVCLAALYGLLWAYWTVLNLLQLLGWLAVVAPATAVCAKWALGEAAGRRAAQFGKEKKKA